ncbi:unnamed protein product [Dracunculus medinensis]|uniref:Mitochondrial import inner membrane translocase subunit n=1 Tax=Dracunculus medinensis TaxID=318479 RepID=A0A0N4U5J1_DRAME|nr:unnamed protein product [Dracunculus medinensis]
MDEQVDLEALKKLTPEQQNQLISGLKQQVAVLNAQAIIGELSQKCTQKCIVSPGGSLTNSEKQCLQRCMDRFMDTWNLVSVALQKRLQDEFSGFHQ